MSQKVTATEAARNFSEILNRVRYGRETFVIVRGGEAVGQLSPIESGQAPTVQDLIETLKSTERPDEQFAQDLEEIQAGQPPMGGSPWDS
jgi:antitoxin (DNA-binding transcriptional repressor) of toxin-antitoxin stability system